MKRVQDSNPERQKGKEMEIEHSLVRAMSQQNKSDPQQLLRSSSPLARLLACPLLVAGEPLAKAWSSKYYHIFNITYSTCSYSKGKMLS